VGSGVGMATRLTNHCSPPHSTRLFALWTNLPHHPTSVSLSPCLFVPPFLKVEVMKLRALVDGQGDTCVDHGLGGTSLTEEDVDVEAADGTSITSITEGEVATPPPHPSAPQPAPASAPSNGSERMQWHMRVGRTIRTISGSFRFNSGRGQDLSRGRPPQAVAPKTPPPPPPGKPKPKYYAGPSGSIRPPPVPPPHSA